jgi:hypothetical protein
VAVETIGGSSAGGAAAGGFEWGVSYDDVAHSATATSAGFGRCTVVVEEATGQRARLNFAAAGDNRPPITIPADIQATVDVTRAIVIGTPLTISPVILKPFPPVKAGGQGGFLLVCEYWQP